MKWYDKVRRIMTDKKIIQNDLIRVFDVSTRGAVGHYLSGRREPSVEQLKRLCDKLGVDMDDIMNDKEPDPVQDRVKRIIRAANKAMKVPNAQFSEEEQLSIYRAAFSAGLEQKISEEKLIQYLQFLTDKTL